jgi:hypothetical protein
MSQMMAAELDSHEYEPDDGYCMDAHEREPAYGC